MVRVGHLIPQIASFDNLLEAFYKAQRGKAAKADVVRYRENLQENLLVLQKQIVGGGLHVGDYNLFKVYDPKERTVCAAPFADRVLHHAIMNVCMPYFERHFIDTTFANREGKGIYCALDVAFKAVNSYRYVAKLDVRKYFDSIDHSILIGLLGRIFKDRRLSEIFSEIISSYSVSENKGLPIGNLTSQHFANFYLSGLDHYIKEILRVPVYVRYMDDMLVFGNDRNIVCHQVSEIGKYAHNVLGLQLKTPVIQVTDDKLPFLGYSVKRNCKGLTLRSRKRFVKKYLYAETMLKDGVWPEEVAALHVLPLFAFVKYAYSKRLRTNVINCASLVGV